MPRERTIDILSRQLLRCATSVGANYRAACRARSAADFIAKLKIVEEEADESLYWLELLTESGLIEANILQPLIDETDEIVAIVMATIKTKRDRMK